MYTFQLKSWQFKKDKKASVVHHNGRTIEIVKYLAIIKYKGNIPPLEYIANEITEILGKRHEAFIYITDLKYVNLEYTFNAVYESDIDLYYD